MPDIIGAVPTIALFAASVGHVLCPTYKQEVLEVYPVETGKQRAKHLRANDPALEKSNKCIVANKKALPGVMTACGCAYAGARAGR